MNAVFQYAIIAGAVYLGVVSLIVFAYVRAIYGRIKHMNQQEQDAIARLELEVGNLSKDHEAQKAQIASLQHDNAALTAANADLNAQLTAAQSDPAEVVSALNALSDKVDAELAPPVVAPPATDPNAAPAA